VKFPELPVDLADPGDVVLDESFHPFVLLALLVCRHRNSQTIYVESPLLCRNRVQASCRSTLPPFEEHLPFIAQMHGHEGFLRLVLDDGGIPAFGNI
jgi:hypothetical protein